MSDLTEGQKAIIADLIEQQAHRLLERDGYVRAEELEEKGRAAGLLSATDVVRGGDAAAPIPDTEEARRIVARWHEAQPRWWDVRRRLDAKVSGLGLIGILILLGADWAQASLRESPTLLRTAVHWIADTDGRIDRRMAVNAAAAAKPEPEGIAPAALGAAMRSSLDRWANDDGFPSKVETLLRGMAGDPDRANPLHAFVAAAMKDRPLLVFHGTGSIGRPRGVPTVDFGCRAMVSHWRDTGRASLLPETLQEKPLAEVCDVTAQLPGDETFELPFYARFHRGEGRRDSVYVILQIVSSMREGSDFGSRTAGLKGLTVHSVSMNDALVEDGTDELDLRDHFERHGSFFVARIDRAVAEGTRDTSPGGEPAARELLHAILVGLDCDEDDVGDANSCGGDWDPQEHVTLRAFVIVNKDGL